MNFTDFYGKFTTSEFYNIFASLVIELATVKTSVIQI